MQRYITRPAVVEATQVADTDFTADHPSDNHVPDVRYIPTLRQVVINSPEGQQIAIAGDWIVRDQKGRVRRLKPAEFEMRYTPSNSAPFDLALAEVARLQALINQLPNPLPGVKWEQAYIEWYYRMKRSQHNT